MDSPRLAWRDGAIRVIVRACRGDVGQAGLEIGIGDPGEVLSHRADGAEVLQALLGIATELLQVLGDEGLQQVVLVGFQGAAVAEDLAEGDGTVVHPATEGVEQGVAVDEVVLEGQQAEEQVAVGVDVGHGTGLLVVTRGLDAWSSTSRTFAAAACGIRRDASHDR